MQAERLFIKVFPILLVLVMLWDGVLSLAQENGALGSSKASKLPFAVVELFTSEGCSSCPPADELLSEINAEALKLGQRVFPLSFHVDYWNYLGWTDPFSDSSYSNRQRLYARAFGSRSVYTPQMVVNGRDGFVGSDRWRAQRSIESALSRPAQAAVSLRAGTLTSPDRLVIEYEVSDAPKNAVLNIALVERGLVREVLRGENAGRTLRHDNVVRAFEVLRPTNGDKGQVELRFHSSILREKAAVIGYVQDASTMAILGSAIVELGPSMVR